ncbi:uncharacterized protein si:ch73-109d9.1 [Danio aesculapii]|uniref:uncharacterized protein si:ch73-109d9.1 n=1 Tax=Danio aesculapii TaxID=1142201 RepID=UPI0024C01010|nr:uncharacterized protein si:ch73-109d9.1 [Danio aesculapii]
MTEALFLTFQSQLSVVMETVLKSAMFEITRLVEDSFLEEVGHHKQEVEVLKLRLQLSESKLREKEREREWEKERERGRRTQCPDCGRTGDSSGRDESQTVETVHGADTLCLGLSLREQSTNPPALTEEMWSTRQRLESNKQTTTNTHSKEKSDTHRQKTKEIITPHSNAQVPQDFLQRLLGSSVLQSESTSDFKPREQPEKDFTLEKEMDSDHSGLLQSPPSQDVHKDSPLSSPNRRVKSEIQLDLLPVKEEEEMVPVWDSINRDEDEMADPGQAELRGSCDQEEIQIGQRFAEHSSTEQGNSQPINKQRTFSVVAREVLTQFQVWQKASYSRNIDWNPITTKIISKLPQFYGREAELIVRCTKMLHNRRDYLRRRAKESALERNLLPMGQRYLIQLQRGDVQNVKM